MDFYDKFIYLCNRADKKPTPVVEELGLNKSAVTNWRQRQTTPTPANIKKIATYFGVPESFFYKDFVDDLDILSGMKLSPHARTLIEIYEALDTVNQAKLLVYAAELAKK